MTKKRRLDEQKEQLKRATFHVHEIEDNVLMFQFDRLTREVLIPFADTFKQRVTKQKPPIRLLFDFRDAGAPSRYMADRLPKIFSEAELPKDARVAFVMDDVTITRFIRQALQNLTTEGECAEFLNIDPALNWLADKA